MLSSIALVFAIRIFGTVLWLVFTAICARLMSVEDFGQTFFLMTIIITGGVVFTWGYHVTILRFGAMYWKEDQKSAFLALLMQARAVIAGTNLVTLLSAMALMFFGLVIPGVDTPAIIALVCLAVCLSALMEIHRDTLRSAGRLRVALMGQSIIRTAVPTVLLAVLFLFAEINVLWILILYCTALSVALIWDAWHIYALALYNKDKKIKNIAESFRAGTATESPSANLKRSLSIWPGEAALILFHRSPGIVLGLTVGFEGAALYLAAERVAQLGVFVTDAVRTAIAPGLARAAKDNFAQEVERASFLMLASGLLGAVLLLVFGGVFLLGFGSIYLQAFPVLCILLVGQISWTVLGPTALICNMRGEERFRSATSSVAVAALLVLLILAPSAELAATSYAFVGWVMNSVLWWRIRKRLDVNSGVFGLTFKNLQQIWKAEWVLLREKLRSRKGQKNES